jgi:hypothetical protein
MLKLIYGILFGVMTFCSEATAQKLIWRLHIDYFWGGVAKYILLQPGGTITFAGDDLGSQHVTDVTLTDRGQDVQVIARFHSPFSASPCSAQYKSFPIPTWPEDSASTTNNARKYRGTILKHFDPGVPDPCLRNTQDITFTAETFLLSNPLSWHTTFTPTNPASFSIRRGGLTVLPKGDAGPYVLVDGDNIATGAGAQVGLENNFGASVTVGESTNWVVFPQGGLIHRPSGQAPSRVHYKYIRQPQFPICAAPDSCIIIAVPPSTFRVSSDIIQQCPVGALCHSICVTLTDVFLNTPPDKCF